MTRFKLGLLLALLAWPAQAQTVLQSGQIQPGHIAKWVSSGHIADGGVIPQPPTNAVQQSGTVTPGHLSIWTASGVVGDAGTALAPAITSLGIVSNSGQPFCISSDNPSTATGYLQTCLSSNVNNNPILKLSFFGTAVPGPLAFDIYGTLFTFPVTVGTFGQCLATSGTSAPLFWTDCGGGGGGSVSITAGDGITVSPSPLTGTGTISLSAAIAAGGPTGSATQTPQITYNQYGQVTTVTAVTITPPFSNITGSLACSQTPALTGNVTTPAGSCATTIAAGAVTNSMLAGSIAASKLVGTDIDTLGTVTTGTWSATTITVAHGGTGAATLGSGLPLFGAGTSAITTGTLSGNTTKLVTTTGSLTNGNCAQWDGNGNAVDSGGSCGGGGGSGTVNAGTAGQLAYYATSSTAVSGNPNVTVSTGAVTIGQAGSVAGTLKLSGSGSGTTTLAVAAAASGTLTLPAATDTLIGKATTDTLTNKTYNTAGTGNAFSINGQSITAVSGNTTKVGTVSGSLTSGDCLKADASGNIVDNGAACGTGTPGGSNTQVQFNNSSAFGGSASLTWVSPTLTVGAAGSTVGQVAFANATSGTIAIQAPTGALGSAVLTLRDVTASIATTTGTLTNGHCLQADASGNVVDAGGACTTGGGGGTVSSGTLNQLAIYTTNPTGTVVGSTATIPSTMTWNGQVITGTYGGTGVNNGSSTITLGGNLTTSGAFNTTLTVTGATNVTLPTTGTLVNTAVTTLSSLTSVGNIVTGQWLASPVPVANGGTGASLTATGGASQVLKQVAIGAGITVGRLACADLSNAATSCSTDATNASNIASGTLPGARLSGQYTGVTGLGTITVGVWQGTKVDLANFSSGNLPVNQLGGGFGASATTFWRGDGTWAAPTTGGTSGVVVYTTNHTLASGDNNTSIEMQCASACTLTIPVSLVIAFKADVVGTGAGVVTFATSGGALLNSAGGANHLAYQYAGATLYNGSAGSATTWVLAGNIAP